MADALPMGTVARHLTARKNTFAAVSSDDPYTACLDDLPLPLVVHEHPVCTDKNLPLDEPDAGSDQIEKDERTRPTTHGAELIAKPFKLDLRACEPLPNEDVWLYGYIGPSDDWERPPEVVEQIRKTEVATVDGDPSGMPDGDEDTITAASDRSPEPVPHRGLVTVGKISPSCPLGTTRTRVRPEAVSLTFSEALSERVDWVTATIPLTHAQMLQRERHIVENMQGDVLRQFTRVSRITGKYDEDSVAIKAYRGRLWIDGNLGKALEGHNLSSITDAQALVEAFVLDLCGRKGVPLTDGDKEALRAGYFTFSRIDLSRDLRLSPGFDAPTLFRDMAISAAMQGRRASHEPGQSILFDRASRYHSTMMYDKAAEVERHISSAHPERERIIERAAGLVRVEVRLGDKGLHQRGYVTASSWSDETVSAILDERIAALPVLQTQDPDGTRVRSLDWQGRAVYHAYRAGDDLGDMDRKTKYKYRALLRRIGVDITKPKAP